MALRVFHSTARFFATAVLFIVSSGTNAELRPLSTDRPDTTESPYSVDKGHYQIEMEPLSWSRNDDNGEKTTTINGSYNLKFGIADNMDLQLVLSPYNYEKTKANGDEDSNNGIGNTDIRWKINLWGNDSGDTAFALMPFVTIPTDDNNLDPDNDDHNEYGLIAPLAFTLPNNWNAAVMLEVDRVRNADDDGYTLVWIPTATASHEISGKWAGFVELVYRYDNDDSDAADDYRKGANYNGNEVYFDAGVTYALTETSQLDFGTNIGLSDNAEDVRFFIGFSIKR
jgi:hypothetical protein